MSMSDETSGERVSRFHEHTNTSSSIRAPPAELWRDLDMEGLLQKFADDNEAPPAAVRRGTHPRRIMEPTGARKAAAGGAGGGAGTGKARTKSDAATVATAEGTFGRFSRVFANVFGGVLGKRKAGHDTSDTTQQQQQRSTAIDPAQAALDERKRAAEEAYHIAKEQGLLPAPKVFVRPGMTQRAWSADTPPSQAQHDPRPRPPLTPRTPGSVARSPSKKDLHRQKRLSKRVSSLEVKLASAKKELQAVLGNECFPAVPPLPGHITGGGGGGGDSSGSGGSVPASSPTRHVFSDDATPLSPTYGFGEAASASLPGKLTKKRKTVAVLDENPPVERSEPEPEPEPKSEAEIEPQPPRGIKRVKSDAGKRLRRTGSRLSRKVSRTSVRDTHTDTDTSPDQDDHVVVIKPGGAVPPVPLVPSGVAGKKVKVVGDDGYGGLGHEIF